MIAGLAEQGEGNKRRLHDRGAWRDWRRFDIESPKRDTYYLFGRLGTEIPAEKNLFHFPTCHRSRSDAGPHQPAIRLRAGGSAGGGRACDAYHEKIRLAQSGRLRGGYRVMAAPKSAGDKSENGAQGITRLSQAAEASCLKSFDTTHGQNLISSQERTV